MGIRIGISSVIAITALTGCSNLMSQADSLTPCNGPVCFVTVTIVDCSHISLSPDPIKISGRGVNIHWDIKNSPPEYTFAQNGIVIKTATTEFHSPMRLTPTKFKLTDRNTFRKDYPYGVNLMKGEMACPQFDPIIANQG